MTLLEIVQALHREAKLPGTAPTSVAALTGRGADLLAWAIEGWNDIQRERDGKWKWLLHGFTLNTVADTGSYAYGSCTDLDEAATITRFRRWHLDDREPPFIYKVSDGEAAERELCILDWPTFRYRYVRGTHTSAVPNSIAEDVQGRLRIGPTPDGIYRLTGDYWLSNQTLAEDDDEPEMPSDYHMLVVWVAITKYGYNAVAREILSRAQHEGSRLMEALSLDQSFSRFSMQLCGPLA